MLCSRNMFNFLMRKDVRKILKRKDSDAGQRGKALEELRASLFSKLHSFGNSKRPQQQLLGPTAALTFNFLVSVSIILMNKLVLGKVGFNYPIFLTFIHYICSWLLMAILKALSILSTSPPSKSTKYSSLMALGIVMSLSTGLANVSLKYNSVGFYQMAKIAVTPTIVLAELMLFRKRVSFQKVLALAIVSIGVAVATVTDLQFHFFGACVAVAWIIPSAVNKIMWSNLQQQDNWTALALMWKTTPITLFFLVTLMPWLDPPGVINYNWNLYNSTIIGISALLGFLLQWSGALALGATSATTHVVLGQFKTCAILLGGFFLFGSNPGTTSICGAVTALVGMSLYTYLNLLPKEQLMKATSRQASYLLPKSKLGKENGEGHERNSGEECV
ncbi:nucleotide/sugar transporter family protein [Actinidia rufa]|uniref:Nucleotide/sugar transporter family protein n=1 Tax=Actinidia rufa TaxID=165716 RepID=A0A7J0GCY6_9ERIC|nr:nucleotide/sugar transporter family protein [Actinidia rufa]